MLKSILLCLGLYFGAPGDFSEPRLFRYDIVMEPVAGWYVHWQEPPILLIYGKPDHPTYWGVVTHELAHHAQNELGLPYDERQAWEATGRCAPNRKPIPEWLLASTVP